MTAGQQPLFELAEIDTAARIKPGAILDVPAGADIARPGQAYRLTVTSAPYLARTPEGAHLVHVRGTVPRARAGLGRQAPEKRAAILNLTKITVIPAAEPAPAPDPDCVYMLPLAGGWYLASIRCPKCDHPLLEIREAPARPHWEFRCPACPATGTATTEAVR
jgi:hypothetical protein